MLRVFLHFIVLVFFSIAVISTTTNSKREETETEKFIRLTCLHQSFIEETQRRNSGQEQRQGLWRKPANWLTPRLICSIPSDTSQDHMSRSDTTHSGLSHPPSISNHKKYVDMPTGQSEAGNSSTEIPSSQVTGNIKVTEKQIAVMCAVIDIINQCVAGVTVARNLKHEPFTGPFLLFM